MTRREINRLSKGDPELRAVLLRQKNAPSGQKVKRTKELQALNASRLVAEKGR